MTAINPCPQCGNIYCEIYTYENGCRHVECDECRYLGPGESSQAQAVRSHNAAQGIDARSDEPPKEVQPEGQEPGPEGVRPNSVGQSL